MLFLGFILLTIVESEPKAIKCDGVVYFNVYHDKILFKKFGKSYHLTMHERTGQLFFSHTLYYGNSENRVIMVCHINTKNCSEVPGMIGGYAVAYDRLTDNIFFGGYDGIYKYNFRLKTANLFKEKGQSIWGLFIGRFFYYIEKDLKNLFAYRENQFKLSSYGEKVDYYYATQTYIYVSNSTVLYKSEKLLKPTPKQRKVTIFPIAVTQISEDHGGRVHFATKNGIYVDIQTNNTAVKVADIEVFGMTFANIRVPNEKYFMEVLIYSDRNAIYVLHPSNHQSCVNQTVKDKGSKMKSKGNANRDSNKKRMSNKKKISRSEGIAPLKRSRPDFLHL